MRAVMLAKMNTLLLGLDGRRKGILLLILNDAKLIKKAKYLRRKDKNSGWNYPILKLEGVDFSDAKLDRPVKLDFADLSGAILRNTELKGAVLRGANLHNADLRGANLSGVKLLEANDNDVEASKERGKPPEELFKMDLSGANLRRADLKDADLSGADLSDADLRGAKNLTQKQLEKASGNDTTQLPDGLDTPASWRYAPVPTHLSAILNES